MAVDGSHHVDHEGDELQVLFGCLAGGEEKDAAVSSEAPVVVFARAVDACKRFLMEQDAEVMAVCNLGDEAHQQEVVVVGEVGFLEDGCKLELIGGNLVVARLGGNAEAVALDLEVEHEGFDSRRDGSEVMVLELLVLGRFVTHQGASGHHQVGTGAVERLIDQKIFLFPSEI